MADTSRAALIARATELADADLRLRVALVARRRASGRTSEDVAAALGWPVETVRDLERHDGDPSLSELRAYAVAVGALVTTTLA